MEDHSDMQLLYKTVFKKLEEIEISAQVETAEMALSQTEIVKPDLAIIDISPRE